MSSALETLRRDFGGDIIEPGGAEYESARRTVLAGSAVSVGGLYWLSRIGEHATYTSALLGPTLVTGAGLGLLFVPLSLVALSRVAEHDSGVASSLLNTGQQVGGSIGLAVLGTVAWTAVANSARPRPPTPRPPPPGPATRCTRAGHYSRGSTATPWPPGSPAGSWSRLGSCCSPWSSPSRRYGCGAPTLPAPTSR
jgi:hypothetical protein